jgi:hypothetical protein
MSATPTGQLFTAPADQAPADQLDAVLAETQAKEKALADANEACKECVIAFRNGERSMKAGRLEAGRLAEKSLRLYVAAGRSRDAAVDIIRLELLRYASTKADADVNELIRSYSAWKLLVVQSDSGAEERGDLPYGHYAEGLSQLVQRNGADEYVLLPAMESECIALFREALTQSLTKEETKSKAKALVNEWTLKQAELRDAAAREAADKARKIREAADKARAAADKAPEPDKLAAQQTAAELNTAANTAEQDSKRAKSAAKAARNRADKISNPPQRSEPEQADSSRAPLHNPLVAAKNATAKDLAESIRAQIQANGKPDDVVSELFRAFDFRKKHAAMIGAAIVANNGKHALEFAFSLAEYLCDHLPAQEPAPVSKVA